MTALGSRIPIATNLARYAVVIVAISIVVWPIVELPVLGLGDYLNHLARMHILEAIDRSVDLQRYYIVHWSLIPYLAMDAIVPALARVFPIYVAGRLFVAACVLMPAASASVLHYAIYRRWSVIPAAGLLLGWNYPLSLGFLNFVFMSGLSVMLFAAWLATSAWQRWLRALLFSLPVLLLYLGHAFAFAGYSLAVAGFELSRVISVDRPSLAEIVPRWLAAAAQALPALMLAATLDLHQAYTGPLFSRYGTAFEKFTALASPFAFRFGLADLLVVVCLFGLGSILAVRLRVNGPVVCAALLVAGAAIAVPTVLWITWGADLRLPLIVAILIVGSVRLTRIEPRNATVLIVIFLGLLAMRSADVLRALGPAESQIRDVRIVLENLPKGARLLTVDAEGPRHAGNVWLSTRWQMGMLAVIERDAFVPTLFTGMTTVRAAPGMETSSTPNGLPLSLEQLRDGITAAGDGASSPDDGCGGRIYWRDWPRKFDYVLVEHGATPYVVPVFLSSIAVSKTVDLYRIDGVRP